MGEAKRRGTYEQRRAEAEARQKSEGSRILPAVNVGTKGHIDYGKRKRFSALIPAIVALAAQQAGVKIIDQSGNEYDGFNFQGGDE